MTKQKPARRILFAAMASTALVAPAAAPAGGVLGDIVRGVADLVGSPDLRKLADAGDALHRGLKETIPLYGPLEEATSGVVHQLTSELGVEVAGPVVAALIRAGIEDAERGELHKLPPDVYRAMSTYFTKETLDKVRWRSGYGSGSIQAASLQLGNREAMVLDYIIVFKDGAGINKRWLVAHELAHVVQYSEWGIDDFAKRYVRNFDGVEAAADRMANEWQSGKVLALRPAPKRQFSGGGGGSQSISNRMYQQMQ